MLLPHGHQSQGQQEASGVAWLHLTGKCLLGEALSNDDVQECSTMLKLSTILILLILGIASLVIYFAMGK
jgi:hypothetical protein